MSTTSVAETPHSLSPAGKPSLQAAAASQIAVPTWWKQRHSWVFALAVALNVLSAWCFFFGLVHPELFANSDDGCIFAQMAMIGLLMAQLYLAAIWLAFGGLSPPVRFALVMLAITLGAFVGTVGMPVMNPAQSQWVFVRLAVSLVLQFVLLAQIVLAPVRWLTGWRIGFDAAYHARQSGRRMQLSLWHFLALTFLATLPLAVYRGLAVNSLQEFLAVALTGLMSLLVAAPLTWLVLGRRRRRRAWLAFLSGLAASSVIGAGIASYAEAGPYWFSVTLAMATALPAALIVAVVLNLVLLRLWGLKVISVKSP